MATANIPWDDGSGQNMSVEWDGTENGEIVITSPTNPSLSSSRNKTIQVRTTAGSPQITRTINVVQEAAVYTYEYEIQPSSSAVIAASGGTISYTATLKTYLQGSLLKTESVTPTCRIISGAGFSAASNAVTAASRGTTYSTSQRSAQVAVEFVTEETGQTLSETVTVTQAANNRVVVYGKPIITSFEVDDIPASGGSVSSGEVEYSQSRHYYYDSGQTEELSSLTTGGQVTFGDPVTAESLGTTVKSRTIIGQLTCQVTMNGQTSVEGDVSVYQQENTFISWVIPYGPDMFPNSGTIDINFERLAWNWTSGYYTIQDGGDLDYFQISTQIESDLIDDVYEGLNGNNGEFYFNDVGVVPNKTSSSKSGTLYLHITAADTSIFDHTEEFDVTQSAGTRTYSEITVNLSYPQASAAGGTVKPTLTYSQTWGYNGSTTGGGTITSGASVSYSGTNINASTGAATVASKGTTVSGVTTATTATVTVSMNGKTAKKSAAVQQAANAATITYGTPVVNLTVADIPASGGTVSSGTVTYSQSRTQKYTSGATSTLSALTTGGRVSYSSAVNGSDLGTTVKSRTDVGTLTATVTMNGKSGSDSATVYQQANVRTDEGIEYGTWQVSVSANRYTTSSSPCPAGGGTCTITRSASRTRTQNYSYTSGATSSTTLSNETATPILSISGTGASLSGTTVTWADRGVTTGNARQATVTATYDGESASETVYQQENTRTTGSITYGDWQISVSANRYTTSSSPCPAGGGTCTISASASRIRVQNYSYTSGSTSTETLSNQTGTPTLSISGTGANLSETTVTWASRGTTTGSVRQATVTATMGSVSATEIVYQQANAIESTSWNNPVVIVNPATRTSPAAGETFLVTRSAMQSGTNTYTSGSTATVYNNSVTWSVSDNATWITTSGTSVTVVANTATTSRQGTVTYTATANGKSGSDTCVVTQEANYLNVSPESLTFTADGGTKQITIDTNESWTIE